MIDNVIVYGINRTVKKLIPKHEISQMIGRAGRSYAKSGNAYVMVPDKNINRAKDMIFGDHPPVISSMHNITNVSFHVLPLIVNGGVRDKESFDDWYSKTLSSHQGKKVRYEDVVSYLVDNECVSKIGDRVIATRLGNISSSYYYQPERLYILKDRMMELASNEEMPILSAEKLSWFLSYFNIIVGGVNENDVQTYRSNVYNSGYFFLNNEELHGYVFYCLMDMQRPKWLTYMLDSERRDIGRLMNACRKIAVGYDIDFLQQLKIIELSITRRVTPKIALFMIDCGVAQKGITMELYELGVRSRNDIENKFDYLMSNGSESLKVFLKNRKEQDASNNEQ